jgi:hypothetical protein
LINKFLAVHYLNFRQAEVRIEFPLQRRNLLFNCKFLSYIVLRRRYWLLEYRRWVKCWFRFKLLLLLLELLLLVILLSILRLLRELLLHKSLSRLLRLLLELWLLLLLQLLESGKLFLVKDLLLGYVVLHILLCNINIRLSEFVLLVLLHLQLLHCLEFV